MAFLRDIRGASAVEFAIIASVFLMLLMGGSELAALLIVRNALESAVVETARFVRTEDTEAGKSIDQSLKDMAVKYSLGLIPSDQLIVEKRYYSSFDDLSQAGSTAPGSNTPVMKITLKYEWKGLTPFLIPLVSADNKIMLQASLPILSELYKPGGAS